MFQRTVRDAWGFRTKRRKGEDFGAWLSRETDIWVKGEPDGFFLHRVLKRLRPRHADHATPDGA